MISLSQELKIQQKLTPQQIQILRLLQVPIVSLEQTIKEEIERNPLLEDDSDDNYTTENDNNYETECYDNYDPESILNNYEEYMEEEHSYREKIEQNKDQQEKNIIFASEISFQDRNIRDASAISKPIPNHTNSKNDTKTMPRIWLSSLMLRNRL